MADLGNILLFFLFPVSVFTALAALAAGITKRRGLLEAARRGAYAAFGVTTLAVLALEYLLVTSDFSIEYVASNTNYALPMFYKIVALWAGHNGSLLLWTWIVTIFIAIVAYQNRRKNNDLMPYVLLMMAVTMVFFSVLSIFISNPFDTLYQDMGNHLQEFAVPDGRGLNPLLQHPAMVIHPPVLFIGYVGSVVPFAFAIAALITGKLGAGWIHTTRRW
ncbi:MAG: cytochrome c biogenesis protein CcsA, partial [Candidatus Marinimicrobia bacterium]|nr:cytochrome c biogenesis protein CcsA [Candidatus Neomarinimicrobiota bacterium]